MARNQTSIAKITRPVLPEVYQRKRLFKMLDQSSRCPVTWISGPPGSGKTTLVASYLAARKLPCIWYQVDEGDADLATFFYYLGLATKKAAPRYKRPLPLLTPEYGLGVPTFTRRYFENLCSRLRPPSVLVFDNYQEIPSESAFHETICTGLSTLPENITAVIISRSEPPAAFTGMSAGNKLRVMGWRDLKLTPQESKGIAKLQEVRPQSNFFEWMHEKTQGWAAGLVLLARAAKSEGIHPEALKDRTPDDIFNYFANELFNKLSEEIQIFLIKTAVLPKINLFAAERLTGRKDAGVILSHLNRKNYFTQKQELSKIIYQYHPLFRQFLLQRALTAFSPRDFSQLELTSARLLQEGGQIEDAAALFISREHWPELTNLILANAQTMILQGRLGTLGEWIEKLPRSTVDKTPYLLYWKASCLMPFNPAESRNYFQRSYILFNKLNDRTGMFLAWSAASDISLQEADDFKYLDDQIKFLNQVLAEEPSLPSREIRERIIMSMFNALALRQPWNVGKNSWEEQAFNLLRTGHDKNLRMYTGVCLVCYHFYMGNMVRAVRVMSFLRAEIEPGKVSPLMLITIKTIDAIYSYFAADFDHALKTVDEALRLSQDTGIHIWDNHLFGHACGAALSLGNTAQADQFLTKMRSIRPLERRFDIGYYHFMSTWHSLAIRNNRRALEDVKLFASMIPGLGFPFGECLCYLMAVQVHHEQGNHKQAMISLGQGSELADRMGSKLYQCMSYLIDAHIVFDRLEKTGDPTGNLLQHGNDSLCKALKIGREQGIKNIPGWRSDVMARLFSRALTAGIEADYVRDLIRMRNIIPDARFLHLENWPWPVKIFTLGQFSLELDGKAVIFSSKTPKKPLELLKAIIALGGRDVREERLIDELWPEASGDLAYKSFEMALQRLRKLINSDKAIRRQDGLLALDDRYCSTDVWAFERLVSEAEKEGAGDREKRALPEKAIRLYNGHFLPTDARQPWVTLIRERLRSKFLRLVTRAGEQYEKNNEWKKAVECFERGLERDAVCEEFYQRLMICHNKLGHRTEAVKTYQRCRAALLNGLGLEPSSKTEDIHSSLINS